MHFGEKLEQKWVFPPLLVGLLGLFPCLLPHGAEGLWVAAAGTEGQRSKLGRGEWSIGMLQTLPLHIPAAGKLLGKRELGKVSGPKTREASGRITSLTAGLADAIGGRDPEVGGAGVEDHGEPLGRCPHAHDPVVLCLWGNSPLSLGQPPACCSSGRDLTGSITHLLPQGLLCKSI